MNSKISKKVDMVKEVFLRDKLRRNIFHILESEWYIDDGKLKSRTPNLQLLTKNKKSIKNNKGEFVDIGRQKMIYQTQE